VRVETYYAVLRLVVADVNYHSAQSGRLWSRSARTLPKTSRRYLIPVHFGDCQNSSLSNHVIVTIKHINVKLQFIHTVNGDGSKTAKIIKRQC